MNLIYDFFFFFFFFFWKLDIVNPIPKTQEEILSQRNNPLFNHFQSFEKLKEEIGQFIFIPILGLDFSELPKDFERSRNLLFDSSCAGKAQIIALQNQISRFITCQDSKLSNRC